MDVNQEDINEEKISLELQVQPTQSQADLRRSGKGSICPPIPNSATCRKMCPFSSCIYYIFIEVILVTAILNIL